MVGQNGAVLLLLLAGTFFIIIINPRKSQNHLKIQMILTSSDFRSVISHHAFETNKTFLLECEMNFKMFEMTFDFSNFAQRGEIADRREN